jgi:hypothetical protein
MAGSANPSQASFRSRDVDLILPVSITVTGHGGQEAELRLICDTFDYDIKDSPLRKRAWVFQEWYLAPRSLVFGCMQLWWQCRESLACETFPRGITIATYEKGLEGTDAMKDTGLTPSQDPSFSHRLWWDLIKQYAGTSLTQEAKDRVIAFSGISTVFGQTHQIEHEYVAGMWRCHFPHALLWCRSHGSNASRSTHYKAPSWSWMSLDGPVALEDQSDRPGYPESTWYTTNLSCCTIKEPELSLVDKDNPTGMLKGGAIRIQGHLARLPRVEDGDIDEGSISFCDFKHAMIRLDEEDDSKNSLVSHLDDISTGQQGLQLDFTETSRTKLPLEHATGAIFALPLLHQTFNIGMDNQAVVGLVLYETLYHPGVFHRIGSFRVLCLTQSDFTVFTQSLETEFPKKSVYIV